MAVDIAVVGGGSPYVHAWEWSGGFGSKYSDPATGAGDGSYGVAFSPDGETLAVVGNLGLYVHAWEWSGGFGSKHSDPATGAGTNSNGVAFSPDGDTLAVVGGGSPYVHAWEWSGGFGSKHSDPATGAGTNSFGVAFSPDGDTLAVVGGGSPYVHAWEWASGFGSKYSAPATGPGDFSYGVAFSPDGDTLAVGGDGSPYVHAWEWSGGFGSKYADPATGAGDGSYGVAFSPDGETLAVAGNASPYVHAWEWSGGFGSKYADPATGAGAVGYDVAFSPEYEPPLPPPATRFYLPSSGTPDISPPYHSEWDKTSQFVRRPMSPIKANSAFASTTCTENVTTQNYDVGAIQYVYGPLEAQDIEGTVKGQMRMQESNAGMNARVQRIIRVVKPDGSTRGTLLAPDTATGNTNPANEFATSLTNRSIVRNVAGVALSKVTAERGDYLVIEIGVRAHNSSSSNYTATFRYGDPTGTATELPEDESTTSDYVPWIEFDSEIKLDTSRTVPQAATIVLTGSPVTLTKKLTVPEASPIALTGSPVNLTKRMPIPEADPIVLTGSPVTLTAILTLTVPEAGPIILTGSPVSLGVVVHLDVPEADPIILTGETPRLAVNPQGLAQALYGLRGSVSMRFRYELRTPGNQFLRDVSNAILSAGLELNNDRAIVRSLTLGVDTDARDNHGRPIAIDHLTSYIAPVIEVLVNGQWVPFQQGLFQLDWPKTTVTQGMRTLSIQGGDLGMILVSDCTDDVYTVAQGTNVMQAVKTILDNHGLRSALPASAAVLPALRQWDVGTAWLTVINDMLTAAGFYALWFDRVGIARTEPTSDISQRTPDVAYGIGDFIADPWQEDALTTRLANKIIVVRTDPSLPALTSVAVNNDPSSPVSIVTLGRTIPKTISRESIPDQTAADAIAAYELQQAASVYRRGTVRTSIDPRRDANEVYSIDYPGVTEGELWYARGWRMPLAVGAQMTHDLSRIERLVAS